MTEKLIPITVMLSPQEVEQLNQLSEQEKRSKSSVLRIAFLDYIKKSEIVVAEGERGY